MPSGERNFILQCTIVLSISLSSAHFYTPLKNLLVGRSVHQAMKVAKHGKVNSPREYRTPIDFQVTWSKVKVKTSSLYTNVVHSISFHPFALKLPNLEQWMPLVSGYFPLDFRSHGQRSRWICWSSSQCYHFNILWTSCLLITKFGTTQGILFDTAWCWFPRSPCWSLCLLCLLILMLTILMLILIESRSMLLYTD